MLGLSCLLFTMGCSSHQPAISNDLQASLAPADSPTEYLIQPGDQMEIKFFYNPELNETVVVRPDGGIALQLVDEVRVAGLSAAELDELLTQKYSIELKKPEVTVLLRSFAGQQVYVGGEVVNPGLVALTPAMNAVQAVIGSGGFKDTAKLSETIIIRKGPDNRPIPIRLDLEKAIYGNNPERNFRLQSYDIVYVPKTAIAKANLFVRQYIQELFLFRGFSFGFVYRVDDKLNID